MDKTLETLLVRDKLLTSLKLTEAEVESLTEAQRTSAIRVLYHQTYLPTHSGIAAGGTLMIQFPHILIGIEKDGYAHS